MSSHEPLHNRITNAVITSVRPYFSKPFDDDCSSVQPQLQQYFCYGQAVELKRFQNSFVVSQ